ncbi:unnamed protein product [Eruca vesicaria subsp. sativa]|uniref:FBD domain-containing protein n=1 Tax=Eruca vesicaria subsp. sativa TaxID=29727 RepID=A0ABC8LGY0_ERUVS|nr:unnamed protein product [Eruca vesicaria subsp. sativa]
MDEKINEDRFFPSLKSLYLGDIVIDERYYFKLILMCPVLEELFIRNDGVSHPPSWIGRVPSYPLKRLVIDYLVRVPEYKHVYSEIEVRIGGPENLVYFEFSSYVHAYYGSFGDMESLVEARLDLRLLESTTRFDDDTDTGEWNGVNGFDDIFGNATILIWRMASYVKILHLSPYSLEALHFGCEFFCEFHNLATLSFESDKDKSWQVLPRLLRITPKLQNLVIKGLLHRVTGRCGDVCPCYHRPIHKRVIGGRKPKVSCLPSLPLKVLEISGYGGTCREIKQMRHFLGKLQCLQLVKIGVQPESDCNKLRSNLMRLPRLSSNCIIQFI